MSVRYAAAARRGALFAVVATTLLLGGCRDELYGRLSEDDANEIVAILLSNGVDGEKVAAAKAADGYAVNVDRSQLASAIRLLKEYGYPKERFETLGDVFKKEGLMSSPLEQRGRYMYALSQSLQGMLSRIDGVLTARVNLVIPDNDPYGETLTPSSAAVFIKYHPESNAADFKSEIKMIVSKSVAGLSYDKVSLMMVAAMTPQRSAAIPWRRALGVRLTADSVGVFWTLFGALFGALAAALGGCGYLSLRLREQTAAAPRLPTPGR